MMTATSVLMKGNKCGTERYDLARGESMDERIKYTQKFDNYVVDSLDIETYSLNWFDKEEFKEYIRLLI